jgi:hypothetical protein
MYDKYIIFVKTKIYSLKKEDNDNDYYREVKTGQGSACEAPPSEVYGLPVFSTA